MQTYSAAALAAMDEGREKILGLLRFDLGSGTYGFVKRATPFTYDSLTYQPGALFEVSALPMTAGLSADRFTVSLAKSAGDPLTPAVLSAYRTEDYRYRPVTVLDALLDPDTNALLSVETMHRGYIDYIKHVIDPVKGPRLEAVCLGTAVDYSRSNSRLANSDDQARRSATDTFFDHAAVTGTYQVKWGE